MIVFVILVHLTPDIVVWIYANWLDKTLVINERRFNALLVIAYIMAGFGTLFELSGMLYATWQNRKLEREEKKQS